MASERVIFLVVLALTELIEKASVAIALNRASNHFDVWTPHSTESRTHMDKHGERR